MGGDEVKDSDRLMDSSQRIERKSLESSYS